MVRSPSATPLPPPDAHRFFCLLDGPHISRTGPRLNAILLAGWMTADPVCSMFTALLILVRWVESPPRCPFPCLGCVHARACAHACIDISTVSQCVSIATRFAHGADAADSHQIGAVSVGGLPKGGMPRTSAAPRLRFHSAPAMSAIATFFTTSHALFPFHLPSRSAQSTGWSNTRIHTFGPCRATTGTVHSRWLFGQTPTIKRRGSRLTISSLRLGSTRLRSRSSDFSSKHFLRMNRAERFIDPTSHAKHVPHHEHTRVSPCHAAIHWVQYL